MVELLSFLLQSRLRIINCHATTETSDLIGGLRPVRGRKLIAKEMLHVLQRLLQQWPDTEVLNTFDLPRFVSSSPDGGVQADNGEGGKAQNLDLPDSAVSEIIVLARKLRKSYEDYMEKTVMESPKKKLKVGAEGREHRRLTSPEKTDTIGLFEELEVLFRRHSSLFEWADGPVATAMKSGDMLLLDELSLAEDAVLERLNSVLEPSRTLVLAEKGEDVMNAESDTRIIVAHNDFRVFATMNPGGDFGKRELSPALRSRFTEVWVPPVDDMSDIELVLARSLANADPKILSCDILRRILEYVEWFNISICKDPTGPFSALSLSLRDVLAWTGFVVKAREANRELSVWDAYCHGAALMHLDGIGLGTGLGTTEATILYERAKQFLLQQSQSPRVVAAFSFDASKLQFSTVNNLFGVHPFWVQTGSHHPATTAFNFHAPTTAANAYRVLRAMQLTKPILLEGKTCSPLGPTVYCVTGA